MGYLSTSLNHLQFPLLVLYSSQHMGLSLPWSGLFLNFVWCILKGMICLHSLSDVSLLIYRNVTDFHTSVLYPTTLLNLFISSRSFCAESLGFSVYSVRSSEYNDSFTSSLPICIPFVFLVWLLWLGLPMLCWLEAMIGHPCFKMYY